MHRRPDRGAHGNADPDPDHVSHADDHFYIHVDRDADHHPNAAADGCHLRWRTPVPLRKLHERNLLRIGMHRHAALRYRWQDGDVFRAGDDRRGMHHGRAVRLDELQRRFLWRGAYADQYTDPTDGDAGTAGGRVYLSRPVSTWILLQLARRRML